MRGEVSLVMEKQKLMSKCVEIQLSEFGWTELDRIANVITGGTREALIRRVLVDHLYDQRKLQMAIPYQMDKPISKDDY
jgi:hypothetical protein